MSGKKRGLSKNLGALLSDVGLTNFSSSKAGGDKKPSKARTKKSLDEQESTIKRQLAEGVSTPQAAVSEIKISEFLPGRFQPRKDVQSSDLESLAESIKSQGVLQPIVVRPLPKGKFEIIAGERRFHASKMAGLSSIPAVVKVVSDEAATAIAVIENMQRENLNAIEESEGINRLLKEFKLTHAEVAAALGKSRTVITNLLRLLNLKPEVKLMLERGDIDVGHAKVLLSLPASMQLVVAKEVVASALSVRQTEALVSRKTSDKSNGDIKKNSIEVDPDLRRLQKTLSDKLGASVLINHGAKGRGKLVIQYNSLDELDGIIEKIA